MEFTAEIIATFLDGEIVGNKDEKVTTVSKIEDGRKGSLSFLSNLKYEQFIYTTEASIVIVDRDFVPKSDISSTLIKVDNAYGSFSKLLQLYSESKPKKTGISPKSSISESAIVGKDCYFGDNVVIDCGAKIGNNVRIYPNSYIGDNVIIGDNTLIYSGVNIYEDCVIGSNVILHSGSVIGADGFGFAPDANGVYEKIPQIGNVVIEDDVEVGANTAIDRATMGSTIIRKGVKLDNLIQIAHNVVVGEHSAFASQVGVSGSTKIGKHCMVGGQAGLSGHITIADYTKIGSQAGIPSSINEPNRSVMGTPAMDARQAARLYAVNKNLPDMYRAFNSMQKEMAKLKSE